MRLLVKLNLISAMNKQLQRPLRAQYDTSPRFSGVSEHVTAGQSLDCRCSVTLPLSNTHTSSFGQILFCSVDRLINERWKPVLAQGEKIRHSSCHALMASQFLPLHSAAAAAVI